MSLLPLVLSPQSSHRKWCEILGVYYGMDLQNGCQQAESISGAVEQIHRDKGIRHPGRDSLVWRNMTMIDEVTILIL